MEKNHVLLIKCPDRKGLIATITDILFKNDHNILVMKEFVEPETNTFFARFEISGALHIASLQNQLENTLPKGTAININPKRKKDIVILVTKEHHCLGDLLVRYHFNELHANVKAVIGNYDVLKEFTQKFDVPFHCISHEEVSRIVFEEELLQMINNYHPDYIVLAKFMRVLSPEFVAKFNERIINIHHSFLPAFIGANPYRQAHARGVKLIGATAHFVTHELDEGPIITQDVIPVSHSFTPADMMKAGKEIETAVLAKALRLVFEDRVIMYRNKTVVFE